MYKYTGIMVSYPQEEGGFMVVFHAVFPRKGKMLKMNGYEYGVCPYCKTKVQSPEWKPEYFLCPCCDRGFRVGKE